MEETSKKETRLYAIGAGIAGLCLIGGYLYLRSKSNATSKALNNCIEEIENNFVNTSAKASAWLHGSGPEVYRYVEAFANTLNLVDSECYVIEQSDRFGTVVSHMIDGLGVYPEMEKLYIKK